MTQRNQSKNNDGVTFARSHRRKSSSNLCLTPMKKPFKDLFPARPALFALLLLGSAGAAFGGSATWDLNPATNNWNTAVNWTPDTVPNGPDTATFALSNKANISITAATAVDGIVFESGASAFTITVAAPVSLFISGVGVTDNSGVTQNFVIATDRRHNQATITFVGSATAGDATYTNFGASVQNAFGGHVEFFNTATAGTGTFVIGGGAVQEPMARASCSSMPRARAVAPFISMVAR